MPHQQSRRAIILPLGGFVFRPRGINSGYQMAIDASPRMKNTARKMKSASQNNLTMLNWGAKPAWAEVWHLWTVVIPRRSITDQLVFGKVWRRHDGRRWIYKKFIEQRQSGGNTQRA